MHRPKHTDINPWRMRVRLQSTIDSGRHGVSAHRLMDDFVSSNEHTVFVLTFEVLGTLDGAVVFAWGPNSQNNEHINHIRKIPYLGKFITKNQFAECFALKISV